MCSEHMSRVVVVGFRPHCDCPETVLNTWPAHDMAILSSISAISSIFLPNWMLMESWCHWVAIDVRICWRCLFYMMHYLKVCFHMTFPFLKGWDITLDFSLDLLSHENLHSFIPSNGMEILFSRIDSSSHTAVSCDLASYCLCLYTVLYLLIYFLVLASFFFISTIFPNQSLGTFFHRYRIPIQFPWFCFWISYCTFGICSQSCCEVLFFVAVEGMLIYFLWSMPDIKPYTDWKKIIRGLIKNLLWLNWINIFVIGLNEHILRVMTKLN